ncbi:MAG: hypothetical protein K1X94_33280 [Sandaracinaceae bacterium]|nr:hypothetical protein [Sandaracinaceae bacterium]
MTQTLARTLAQVFRAFGALLSLLFVSACATDPGPNRMRDAGTPLEDARVLADAPFPDVVLSDAPGPDAPACETPAPAVPPDVVIAPEFAASYSVFSLGPPPGIPGPLGGMIVSHDDPSTLLIGGASETPSGAIYSIRIRRSACGHIVAWDGTATQLASAPYVDANLLYGPEQVLVFTEWPQFQFSQLRPGDAATTTRTDLRELVTFAAGDRGAGGIGYVPAALGGGGAMRIVTWPTGDWYHLSATFTPGGTYTVGSVTLATNLPNGPGGFAYIPAGSPGFAAQSIIVAEWSHNSVAAYEVDGSGDPIPATRRDFLSYFRLPWGAYFEPETGDYLFLDWGGGNNVLIVQGFVPPPDDPLF